MLGLWAVSCVVSFLPGLWACVLLVVLCCSAVACSYILGEALSVFSLPVVASGLGFLYSLVGCCPFDNKFLIIQKKIKIMMENRPGKGS